MMTVAPLYAVTSDHVVCANIANAEGSFPSAIREHLSATNVQALEQAKLYWSELNIQVDRS